MRVIDCECGKTLQAANDEDLASAVRSHVEEDHPGTGMSDDQAQELVSAEAYEALDS
jgi:hypothetical protein